MKNFYVLAIAGLTLTLSFISGALYADPVTPITFNFNSTPQHLTGGYLQVGSTYKFSDVAAGTSAVVTIVSATGGASVDMLDDNNLTKPEAFSPRINVQANSDGMVEFKIEYYAGNSNNLKTLAMIAATAMDIDGSTGVLYERDALDMGAGSILSYQTSPLEINVVQTGNQYLATNIGGIEYTGVDTSAKQVMFTLTNTNLSSFTYKAGVNNLSGGAVTRQKGIYFKGFNYSSLPVRYTNFSGSVYTNGVQLAWTTEYERDNDHFEVERSFDRTSFNTVGLVLDAENIVNNSKSYRFKDNAAILKEKDIVYYRLKQIDKDGTFSYSTVIAIKLKQTAGVDVQVSPNPFTEKVVVRFSSSSNQLATVRLVNVAGQVVLSKQMLVNKGFNNLSISQLNQLPTGNYVVNVIADNKVVGSQKISKQ
jgi:hypothetical protein